MIQKLRMHTLRNNEFLGFHKGIAAIVTQNDPVLLNVVAASTAYSGRISELEALYKQDTFNPITAELEELDQQRDDVFNGILNTIIASTYHFDPDMKTAALLLQRDLEKYGAGFIRGNYNAETIDLQNIIADWRTKPELANAVDMLGLFEWIQELERLNNLFDSKYIDRTNSNASKPDETATSKRTDVVTAYETLIKFIDSYAFLNDTELYRTTVSQINELIDQYSHMLKQRRGRQSSESKV